MADGWSWERDLFDDPAPENRPPTPQSEPEPVGLTD